jgi:hypothetical protein
MNIDFKTRNHERSVTIASIEAAVSSNNKEALEKAIMKLSIPAVKPTDIGFSIHDLQYFLYTIQDKMAVTSDQLVQVKGQLSLQQKRISHCLNGVGVSKKDIELRNSTKLLAFTIRKRIDNLNKMRDILENQLTVRGIKFTRQEGVIGN